MNIFKIQCILTLRCASHHGVKFRGLHPTTESSSGVCIIPRSQVPGCAMCIPPRSQVPGFASHRRVKLHTAESKQKSWVSLWLLLTLSHKVTTVLYIQSGKVQSSFLSRILFSDFYHGGASAQTLLEKRGGNISYLCGQNFVLLCLDSNQLPSDLE